jgi:hypothetical protein
MRTMGGLKRGKERWATVYRDMYSWPDDPYTAGPLRVIEKGDVILARLACWLDRDAWTKVVRVLAETRPFFGLSPGEVDEWCEGASLEELAAAAINQTIVPRGAPTIAQLNYALSLSVKLGVRPPHWAFESATGIGRWIEACQGDEVPATEARTSTGSLSASHRTPAVETPAPGRLRKRPQRHSG